MERQIGKSEYLLIKLKKFILKVNKLKIFKVELD